MSMSMIAVPWERLRAGVTIRRSDGQFQRAATVEKGDHSVLVVFDDGCVEQHERSEQAQVITRP
jgi:hypothetical protein